MALSSLFGARVRAARPGRKNSLAAGLCAAAALSLHAPVHAQLSHGERYSVQLSAAVQTAPARITLVWPADPGATGYLVQRRNVTGADAFGNWGTGVSLPAEAVSYVDNAVAVGVPYEYRVTKQGQTTSYYSGTGYLHAGIELPPVEQRGTILLLVDATHASALADELARLKQDLVGDGWRVVRRDVSRTATVPQVKSLILTEHQADPQLKALLLFDRIRVPYSGNIAPDGHTNHLGAWPADAFYGDLDGVYTDTTVNSTGASLSRHHNVPGDGKYDQTYASGPNYVVELEVGRVDLSSLPAFNKTRVLSWSGR